MLVFLLILLPLATAVLILGARWLRPAFSHHWLVALLGSLFAWILAWIVYPDTPLNLPVANWQPRIFLPISPALLLDLKSWPFIIALTTLTLAVLVTDVARPATSRSSSYWYDLIAYLLLTGFSILATLSGNIITLLLTWTLLAGVELLLRLSKDQESLHSRPIVLALSLRFASLFCVIYSGMIAYSAGLPLSFTTVSPQISTILLFAAGISLGVLPTHPPLPQDDPKSAGLTALLRLAPCAPALVLLALCWNGRSARKSRKPAPVPDLSCPDLWQPRLVQQFYTSNWDSLLGHRPVCPGPGFGHSSPAFRQSGMGPGNALRRRRLLPVHCTVARAQVDFFVGLASISGLPFTPTWAGANLYAPPFQPMLVLILLGQGLFLAGTLRQALRQPAALIGAERWLGALYSAGLLTMLVFTHFTIPWFLPPGSAGIRQLQTGWIETGVSMVAVGLAIVAMTLFFSRPRRKPGGLAALKNILELGWFYRIFVILFRSAESLVVTVNAILDGRAAILWTLLALALLISLFVSLGPGG